MAYKFYGRNHACQELKWKNASEPECRFSGYSAERDLWGGLTERISRVQEKGIYVQDLIPNFRIDSVFVISEKKVLPTKTGRCYISLKLIDKTGVVPAKIWDNSSIEFSQVPSKGPVRVVGRTETFDNVLQVIVDEIQSVSLQDVKPEDFIPSLEIEEIQKLRDELKQCFYKKLVCDDYRALWNVFFMERELQKKFAKTPGAVKIHHAYLGGLMEHTVGVLRIVDRLCDIYEELNRDLLLTGALFHDIGKVREYIYDWVLDISDEGRFLGHIILGIQIFDELLKKLGTFPEEKAVIIRHLITSHHGQLEYGSPRVPMVREAIVLHFADNLDARINELNRLYEEAEGEATWTAYQQRYGTQFFITSINKGDSPLLVENSHGLDLGQLSLDFIIKQRKDRD